MNGSDTLHSAAKSSEIAIHHGNATVAWVIFVASSVIAITVGIHLNCLDVLAVRGFAVAGLSALTLLTPAGGRSMVALGWIIATSPLLALSSVLWTIYV